MGFVQVENNELRIDITIHCYKLETHSRITALVGAQFREGWRHVLWYLYPQVTSDI